MLELEHAHKSFHSRQGRVDAVVDVSFTVQAGECFGLIGESGSGKSTLSGIAAGLVPADAGVITLDGVPLGTSAASRRHHQSRLQLVYQDPRSSFDPRMSVARSLREPLTHKLGLPRKEQDRRIADMLDRVGLSQDLLPRGIGSVSVGQAQRLSIARALLAEPSLIICDEITASLDVLVQAEILALLERLRVEEGLTMVFVCHDIAVVSQVATHVGVMKAGRLVEQGTRDAVIHQPQHEYTKLLLSMAR